MPKKFVNTYIPNHTPADLKWYGRDGLLNSIDQFQLNDFISNPDNYNESIKVKNFDIIHRRCRG